MKHIYSLANNIDYPFVTDPDFGHVLFLEKYPGYGEGEDKYLAKTNGFHMPDADQYIPETVTFTTYLDDISVLDFPSNDVWWPIMSSKMIEVLEEISNREYKKIPVEIVQNDGSINYDYSIFHFSEYLDFTIYQETAAFRELESEVFPTIFRTIKAKPTLFIPEETKEVFESKGLEGIRYKTLDVFVRS